MVASMINFHRNNQIAVKDRNGCAICLRKVTKHTINDQVAGLSLKLANDSPERPTTGFVESPNSGFEG
jgi:hypothetical protein